MNEAILIVTALLDIGIVMIAFYLGRPWLFATIAVNLLLIGVLGAKLVPFFGHVTNAGNVFYASVFFAMYLILEHESPSYGIRALWVGAGSIVMFFGLTQLTLLLQSAPETHAVSDSLNAVLWITPRIAFASLVAYVAAQYINIWLFTYWQEIVGETHWWLRIVCIMTIAQLVDSAIFFTIAFGGSVDAGVVIETLFVGYLLKVAIGIAATPLLYLSHRIPKDTFEPLEVHA